jgi:hypothetical protein
MVNADVLKQLVPFGIVGLAIVAVVLIALNPKSNTNRALSLIAVAVIAALAVFDRIQPTPTLKAATPTAPPVHPVPTGVPGGYVLGAYQHDS